MVQMPIVDLFETARTLGAAGKRVSVLWQEPESLAFVARGREYRSEFHINPSDELMYQIKGEMRLHYRTPEGKEEVAVLRQGSVIYTPAGVPHSPRFPPDAYALIVERKRRPGEIDRFHWYCPKCDNFLHEETFVVHDYKADPVSLAYRNFFESEAFRTCGKCGHVMPAPDTV
ncbi:MAG: cupin domain-containing protein [Burkholderiales bacterium]|nr:cupin domain-containing protein [Burkholderiales bacterium]